MPNVCLGMWRSITHKRVLFPHEGNQVLDKGSNSAVHPGLETILSFTEALDHV